MGRARATPIAKQEQGLEASTSVPLFLEGVRSCSSSGPCHPPGEGLIHYKDTRAMNVKSLFDRAEDLLSQPAWSSFQPAREAAAELLREAETLAAGEPGGGDAV